MQNRSIDNEIILIEDSLLPRQRQTPIGKAGQFIGLSKRSSQFTTASPSGRILPPKRKAGQFIGLLRRLLRFTAVSPFGRIFSQNQRLMLIGMFLQNQRLMLIGKAGKFMNSPNQRLMPMRKAGQFIGL